MTPRKTHPFRPLILMTCLVLAAAVAGTQAASALTPRATRACTPPKYPGQGYFTLLTVSNTTCKRGKEVAVAYYKCRVRQGGKDGKCPTTTRILRYKCRETKRVTIPTEINARVKCTRGTATIIHTYQQNT